MRLLRLVKFLIFCWAIVIIGVINSSSTAIIGEGNLGTKPFFTETGFIIENNFLTHYISKGESKLPDLRVEYNVQQAFEIPELVCIYLLTSNFLREYPGNPPDRAAPEPTGPL